jgi:hypothetical protein
MTDAKTKFLQASGAVPLDTKINEWLKMEKITAERIISISFSYGAYYPSALIAYREDS